MVRILIVNKSSFDLPSYESNFAAGLDLRANLSEKITIAPMDRKLIPTGLFIALPKGYEAQIRPRSGTAIKYGITVLNSPGTIDSDYRGEIKIILINHGKESYTIKRGMRIAQMVISPYKTAIFEKVPSLDSTARNAGGFGSTGV